MTETTFASPPLQRLSGGLLGGVCLGLARTTGTSHVLWRVLFLVLVLFGGLGLALYLICWVAIPAEGQAQSLAERVLQGPDRSLNVKQVLLLSTVVVATAFALHDNAGAVLLAGLGVVGYVWWRGRHTAGDGTTAVPAASGAAFTTGVGVSPDPAGATGSQPDSRPPAGGVSPPPPPPIAWSPPPRERSVLTPLVLSVAAVVVGVLLLLAAAGTVSVPTEVVLAAALAVIGLGLVVSAFWGRARGLVLVAVLLGLALGGMVAARPAIDHGLGERNWFAATSGRYELGIGEARLRLTDGLAKGGDVVAEVAVGHLVIEVPEGLAARVVVDAHVNNGDIEGEGVDANGRNVSRRFVFGPEGAPEVHVSARVRAGQVEVRRG